MVTDGPGLKSRRKAAGVERRNGVRRDDRPGWARVRSGLLLVLLLTGIGVGLAAVVGALALASAALIDRALG